MDRGQWQSIENTENECFDSILQEMSNKIKNSQKSRNIELELATSPSFTLLILSSLLILQ